MRRMTVWKSCHGVCNLEACFLGAISMVGGNYARCHQNWNFDLTHTANMKPRRHQTEASLTAHNRSNPHLPEKNEATQRSLVCPSP